MIKGTVHCRFAVLFPSILVCSLFMIGLAQSARADTLSYVFTGIASGTVGTTSFTNAVLTVSAIGDPSDVIGTSTYLLFFPSGTAVFSIGGLGSGSFSGITYVFDNQTVFGGTVGFGLFDDIIQIRDDDLGSTVFSTYNLQSPIGPIGFVTDPSVADWIYKPTSLGDMTVRSYTDVSFQAAAPVPEPSTFLLLGTGLGGLALAAWRRRK